MKCRNIKIDDKGNVGVSFFGRENYVDGQEAIRCSIIQKLSVIKEELWYDRQFGIPLIDKVTNKSIIDSYIARIILESEGVINIEGFESEIVNHNYECYFVINTKYGQLELSI